MKEEQTLTWVDKNNRLPSNDDIILVRTDKGCFATAYLHGEKSGFIVYGDDAYREFGKITHWANLKVE